MTNERILYIKIAKNKEYIVKFLKDMQKIDSKNIYIKNRSNPLTRLLLSLNFLTHKVNCYILTFSTNKANCYILTASTNKANCYILHFLLTKLIDIYSYSLLAKYFLYIEYYISCHYLARFLLIVY